MTMMNEGINTIMESYGGGVKRKREEKKVVVMGDVDEDTEEFDDKKKFDESKEVSNFTPAPPPYSSWYKVGGQILGAGAGVCALYIYKSLKAESLNHPSKYLYKDLP
jgi:hypothetical protein